MKKRNPARNRQDRNSGNKAIYTKYFLLSAVCGVVLVASFFFAARQHFSSIDYSMQNSKLKRQVEELQSNKQSLLLAREMSLNPAEIKKAAKKLGFSEVTEATAEIAKTGQAAIENAKLDKSSSVKTAGPIKLVQKTVQTAAVVPADKQKAADKTDKRDPLARDRKVQIAKR